MKIRNKEVRGFLILLAVAQTINLGVFMGMDLGQKALAGYIYQTNVAPFLAQASVTAQDSKIEPINKLLKK